MRVVVAILAALLVVVQVRLWSSDGPLVEVHRLERQIVHQRDENAALTARNHRLETEIADLKHGTDAIEEHARHDLGMVGKNETFYEIVEP